jgi:hypothetical protein
MKVSISITFLRDWLFSLRTSNAMHEAYMTVYILSSESNLKKMLVVEFFNSC